MQTCFNFKFNLYNKYESPWEGTRVSKKKNLKSIDFMRQKVRSKNLKYKFYRFDKEKSIQISMMLDGTLTICLVQRKFH